MCYDPSTNQLPNFWRNYGPNVADYVRKRIRDEDVSQDFVLTVKFKNNTH